MGMKAMDIIMGMLNKEIAVNKETRIVMDSAFVIRDSVKKRPG